MIIVYMVTVLLVVTQAATWQHKRLQDGSNEGEDESLVTTVNEDEVLADRKRCLSIFT